MQQSALGGPVKFEDEWFRIRPVVENLLNQQNVSKEEWQGLFWSIHRMVLWDDLIRELLQNSLNDQIVRFIKAAKARIEQEKEDSSVLLKAYIAEWTKFFAQCDYIPLPFHPLENQSKQSTTSKKKSGTDESIVRKILLDSWNEHIFSKIKHRLQESAMQLVLAERNGEAFDSQLVIGVRESYVNLCSDEEDKLKIYRENFEKAYIEATQRFYKSKACEYLELNGILNYMIWADAKLKEEEQRGLRYLETGKGSTSMDRLSQVLVQVIVVDFQQQIIDECLPLIEKNQTDKLNLMFRLLDRVPQIEPMLSALEQYIVRQGLADMVSSAETITNDCEKYVERLLELFDRFSALVRLAFDDDPRFLTARDKAYRAVVNDTSVFKLELPLKQRVSGAPKNQPESRCPELLANYCDLLLRKTPLSKRLSSEEVEGRLKNVLLVLKYIQNKDVFMRYHKAHLTRRLILETSADNEKEELMVEWLRDVGMPADYVNKLQRMFQDIKVSNDLNQAFKDQYRNNNNASSADSMNIKILNTAAWSRSSERITVSLPRELEDIVPEVEEFYKQNHNGRKLQWHHLMSNGVVTMSTKLGKFDLEVTTFQMAVFYVWNQRPYDWISFENLRLATELPDIELRRTLWSLVSFPKLKRQVILMEPVVQAPKDFRDDSMFRVNQDFAVVKNGKAQNRGKLNLIGRLQLATEKSREEDNEDIVRLRIYRTQEAINQIMKMRKRINNAQLQTELVEILKNMFLPSRRLIKEQIEWLIENGYMKRDTEDMNYFIYVA